jgi:Flp pilus assembly protein TadD
MSMNAIRTRRGITQLAMPAGLAVLAAALVAGTGAGTRAAASPSPDRTATQAQAALAAGKVDKAITLAEAIVSAAPRDAGYRTLLGNAYLRAGRFESAAEALNDALALGDNSARTALQLALAQVGAGRNSDAVAILDDWRDAIAAPDLGLALALAGETGRGVAILADAVRGGDNSPKARQNLAYAYALDGRWREARLMAAQDVPANQIDDRIGEWAARARPEDARTRVAALLAVPVRADSGVPAALALVTTPGAQQAATEQAAATEVAAATGKPDRPAPDELPPVTSASAAPAADLAQYWPVAAPVASPVSAPAVVSVAPVQIRQAVVQPLPTAALSPRAVTAARATKPDATSPRAGTHLAQLGAFSSEQGARRAWGIYAARTPQLKQYRMMIIKAVVRGKTVWRVAAAGLNSGKATGLCAIIKAHGSGCFAYAAGGMGRGTGAPMLAQAKPAAVVSRRVARHGVTTAANARHH